MTEVLCALCVNVCVLKCFVRDRHCVRVCTSIPSQCQVTPFDIQWLQFMTPAWHNVPVMPHSASSTDARRCVSGSQFEGVKAGTHANTY